MSESPPVNVVIAESEPVRYERIEFGALCPACGEVADWVRVHSVGDEPKRYEALHGENRLCVGLA
jgi:hypothetical protein